MKETKDNDTSIIELIKASTECIEESKKKQKIYFIITIISILIGIVVPQIAIPIAILGVFFGIKFISEYYHFKKRNKPRYKYMKTAIADMLENEHLEETLNINSIRVIPSNVSFYNDNLEKCVVEGDYILVRDNKNNYVIRKYYNNCIGNYKVEILNPETEEDMLTLEQDAPNVYESIKKLRLK